MKKKIILSFILSLFYISASFTAELSIAEGYAVKNSTKWNISLTKQIVGDGIIDRVIAPYETILFAEPADINNIHKLSFYSYGKHIAPLSKTHEVNLVSLKNGTEKGKIRCLEIGQGLLGNYNLTYTNIDIADLIGDDLKKDFSEQQYNFQGENFIKDNRKILDKCFPGLKNRGIEFKGVAHFTAYMLGLASAGAQISEQDKRLNRYVLGLPKYYSDNDAKDAYSLTMQKWTILQNNVGNIGLQVAQESTFKQNCKGIIGFITVIYKAATKKENPAGNKAEDAVAKAKKLQARKLRIASFLKTLSDPKSDSGKFLEAKQYIVNDKQITKKSSPYDILGVSEDATDQAINKAANQLLFKWHPDKQLIGYTKAELTNMTQLINGAKTALLLG